MLSKSSGKSVGLKNLKPFPKGVSGNPKGKPKGVRNFSTVIREFLENVETTVNGKKGDGYLAVVATLFKLATTKEDISAIREIIDRLDGKAKQVISGDEEAPLGIIMLPAKESSKKK